MWRSARYGLMNLLLAAWIAGLLAGGAWSWAVFAATALLATIGDEASGDDLTTLGAGGRAFYNINLYATLPLIALGAALSLGLFVGPTAGFVDIGWLWALFGASHAEALSRTGPWSLVGVLVAGGLFFGAAGINVAHELMHRTGDRLAQVASRWLLAFSWDTTFAIEHVHGHHRHVATARDPATARRGEYVLAFVLRSTIGQFRNAFAYEQARLARKGQAVWSWRNLALRGQFMSVAIALVAYAVAGWVGVAAFLALAAQGKLYLELVNYVEHYGLVRAPGGRVEARHAWNCHHVISNAVLYNLPRHSTHHMFAAKPFWALEADPDAPLLPFGYKTMILIALVPPLWRSVMEPRLADWDARFASAEERRILAESYEPAGRLAA